MKELCLDDFQPLGGNPVLKVLQPSSCFSDWRLTRSQQWCWNQVPGKKQRKTPEPELSRDREPDQSSRKCTHKMDRPHRTHGWKVSWKMLPLAASVLSSCFLLTRAQETTGISIRVVPEALKEGDSVTLTPEDFDLKKIVSCKWYRGAAEAGNIIVTSFLFHSDQTEGTAYTGRETVKPDCSLYITDLKPDDSGIYSFKPEGPGVTNTGATNITVSEVLSNPVLWPTESLVSENTTVTLHCNTSDRLDVSILWFKDGNPVPPKTGISEQNRTLMLTGITKEDEGIYTCQAVNPVSNATSNPSKITIAYSSDGSSSSSSGSAGALAGTVIGSLAVILVLVGTLTYVFLRVCRRNGKTSTQVVSTPQIYENVLPPGQVHPENSSSAANTYETLQPRIPSVYEEIKR
ncbi:carcinoembryonic antigen-related cell adhesion molecule 16-like [Podarcis raffonei]|uniref:carcinoembryonic antigen-related cell adhesion molecule 16-like n=1 Tax=Podarcis raffonei TaxID=65483 RepID=UPI00232980FE|nr:carcinoembryonic antigen-related cell adhesion molecule 16-like [Podarcis raffonei]